MPGAAKGARRLGETVIGPGHPGAEGFARRLNRNVWLAENRDRRLTDTEEMAFALVLSVAMGGLMAIGLVTGVEAAHQAVGR